MSSPFRGSWPRSGRRGPTREPSTAKSSRGLPPAQVVRSTDRTQSPLSRLPPGRLLVHQRGTPSPEHPLVSGENSVLPGPLRPGDYSVRPPGPPGRARCRRTMVRRVRSLVPDPGSAVGSAHRWARGTTNRWVGARFVALFADAHAPNDMVEADRARGPFGLLCGLQPVHEEDVACQSPPLQGPERGGL